MRRPWVRLLALGALLFAGDALTSSAPGGLGEGVPRGARLDDEQLLFQVALAREVHRDDPVVRRRLARNMRFALPDDARSDAELAREAIALGMHESDLVVRRRLVQRMTLALEDSGRGGEPTEAELAGFLRRHRERFWLPERVTLTQLYFRDEARAQQARAALPVSPSATALEGLGEQLLIPRFLRLQRRRELERLLGPAFASAALDAREGRWSGPLASAYGSHWVFVHERLSAEPVPLAAVRSRVRESFLTERRARALREGIAILRERYGVPAPEPAA